MFKFKNLVKEVVLFFVISFLFQIGFFGSLLETAKILFVRYYTKGRMAEVVLTAIFVGMILTGAKLIKKEKGFERIVLYGTIAAVLSRVFYLGKEICGFRMFGAFEFMAIVLAFIAFGLLPMPMAERR